MALSEDSIKMLIQTHAHRLISESDYKTLRNYLLKRQPITEIINPIIAEVSNHYAAEKQTRIHQLTQKACESQAASDEREASIDAKELVKDDDLKLDTTQELARLKTQKQELELEYNAQKALHEQATELLNNLYSQQSSNENYINDILKTGRTLSSTQVHIHPYYKPRFPGILVHNQFQPNNVTIPINLAQQYETLVMARQRLIDDINRQNIKKAEIFKALTECSDKKSRTQGEISRKYILLNDTLPAREKYRKLRNDQRTARASAKRTMANTNECLSHKNLDDLDKQIELVKDTSNQESKKWLETVTSDSYLIYLKELKQALEENKGLKITINESRALKEILDLMDSLPEMETKKDATMAAILKAQNELDLLRRNLKKKTDKVPITEKSISELKQRNQRLEDENKQLSIKSLSLAKTQSNALYSSYVGISGSVLSGVAVGLLNAGLLNSLIISPIFFAIPGGLGLVALVSLTVALVTYYNKSYTDSIIKNSNDTIFWNELNINQKQGEITEDTEKSIPKLQQDIKEKEQKIEEMTAELCAQDTAIKQKLTRADKIIPSSNSNSTSFFKAAPAETQLLTQAPSDGVSTNNNEVDDPSTPEEGSRAMSY